MKLALPGLALANQFYTALQAQGGGRLGTQGLMLAFERMNALDIGANPLQSEERK